MTSAAVFAAFMVRSSTGARSLAVMRKASGNSSESGRSGTGRLLPRDLLSESGTYFTFAYVKCNLGSLASRRLLTR